VNGSRFPTFGILLGSGLIAGLFAYAISRGSVMRRQRVLSPQEQIMERAKDLGGTEAAKMSREFISERVVPEMKPVILDLIKEAENYVDHYFEKAQKAVKSM
jgi:hypothetical protein